VHDLAVDEGENFFGWQIEQRVGAKRTADAAHHDRGVNAVSRNVADDDPQFSGGQGEQVVPVAADRSALGGNIASREFNAGTARKLFGQQAAFEQSRRGAFDRQCPSLGRTGDAVSDNLQQLNILIVERPVF
jgi:hypothetical protein